MIGFYTPYNHCEATAMVLNLATLSHELCADPLIVASGPKSPSVHVDWDRRAISVQKQDPQGWLSRGSHWVWTSLEPNLVARAKRIKRTNILLPLWHQLRYEDASYLRQFDAIACPSQASYRLLAEEWELPNVHKVEWSLLSPVQPARTYEGSLLKVLMLVGPNLKRQLAKWLYALELVLDRLPQVRLTILRSKPSTREDAELLRKLQKRLGNRVVVLQGADYQARQVQYAQHDWLLWPAVCDHSSQFPLEAIHAGLPVIAPEVPPHTHGLLSGLHSHLFPVRRLTNLYGVPQADPTITELVDGLLTALGNGSNRAYLEKTPRDTLLARQQTFRQQWASLWDLVEQPV